jgi:hypothetical protein
LEEKVASDRVGEAARPPAAAHGRVTIRVSEPVRLRDYYRRLGAEAEIIDDESVRVEGDRDAIEVYLRSWSSINKVEAALETVPAVSVRAVGGSAVPRLRLGDLLLNKGMITGHQLDEALSESRTDGELLGRILLRHRWIFEDELARTLAEQLRIPYVNLRTVGVDYAVAALIPTETGLQFAAVPIAVVGDRVRVAFADPCDDRAHQVVRDHIPNYEGVVAEFSDIEQAWRTLARRNRT